MSCKQPFYNVVFIKCLHILTRFQDIQNCKPPKDNLFKDERKALKELQSDTSIVILPAGKGRSTVILNREDYFGKMYGSYK